MTQVIPLNKKMYAVCDSDIHEYLMQWNWTAKKQDNYFYPTRHRKRDEIHDKELIYMHYAVLDYHAIEVPTGMVVDHINRNPLDNRKGNLRVVTVAQNALNAQQRNSKSGYIGVRWDNNKQLWLAYITIQGKPKFVCYAGDAKTAAIYRDKAALKLYDNAALNFPEVAAANNVVSNVLPPYQPTKEELEFLSSYKRKKIQPKKERI